MNRGLWIARKNYLTTLIKKVSDDFGGDEINALNLHIKEVLESCPDESIEDAIDCYFNIAKKME